MAPGRGGQCVTKKSVTPAILVSMPTIKEIRTREGLTQDDLAAAAGVSRRRVIELEHGYRPSRGDSLARVAAALGVSVEEIGAAQGGGS